MRGQSDWKKFELARKLNKHVELIRKNYLADLSRENPTIVRQRAVAMWVIDRMALRAGGDKDTDKSADTVGCCSLRVEHIKLESDGQHVIFDFLGKDSIRYYNRVAVPAEVFACIQDLIKGKSPQTDLFDELKVSKLNSHLSGLMPGLTAKVFRTFNASSTLEVSISLS